MLKIRKKRKSTLFRRYFKSASLIIFCAFLFFGFTMMVFVSGQWWNEKVETLTRNARNISISYAEMLEDGAENGEGYVKTTLDIVCQATVSDYFISDLEGNIILCADDEDAVCERHAALAVSEEHMKRAIDGGFSDYATLDEFGEGRFLVAVPVRSGDKAVAVVFAVEDAITGLLPYVSSIMTSAVAIMFVALLIVFLAIFIITRSITEPLSEMEEVTSHIAKGDFSHRVSGNYKDRDLTAFAQSLNKMADELAVEEQSRRSFVANVSHELKTPMTSIGGFIDGILDGTVPPEDEKKYLQIVSSEVRRLSRMVVSMLNISKIEAGEIQLAATKYDVGKQIFETLLLFEQKIEEKHIEIDGFEKMRGVMIEADRDLLQQVIYNLFDNAVKFTPENGKITVNASSTQEGTTVAIRNSGAGVSEEEIARIFERFYKVDKSRSFDTKGVGLGLYIVKTIVNMHEGEITASSKQGEYTEFSFEIPFSE